jgi:dTDP-4-amino-4,6-dideoxygalactose transaminase
LAVVEDACQAQGAQYRSSVHGWRRAGAFGKAGAFSFYPGKNLGACGDAGAVTTDDEHVARTIRMLRDHGQAQKYYHEIEGYNGRLDAIQAAFLRIKLGHLEEWNAQRRAAAARYSELLLDTPGIELSFESPKSKAIYHLYVIRSHDRDRLAEYLKANGVHTGLHYPLPVHLQHCYRGWGCQRGDLPITERVASQVLSLPMFPGLTAEQQERVASAIRMFAGAVVPVTERSDSGLLASA